MKQPASWIAGHGCICASGNTSVTCYEGALNGCARFLLPKHRVESAYTSGYPVFLVDPAVVLSCPKDQSLSLHFFLTAAKESFAQAGLEPAQLTGKKVGVIVGTSVDASFHCLSVYKNWRNHNTSPQDIAELSHYFASATAQAVSRYFGFSGPFQTIVTACASGTDAIGLADSWIRQGWCDAVLCGGTDEMNLIPYDGFIRLLIASKEKCKPFDKNRNGINIGEGAAAMLLTSQALAKELNLTPKGYVLGYGNSCDAYHPTAPDPQAKGLKQAISFALQEGNLSATDLAFCNAHGTASPANDAAEACAFKEIFPALPVWGSKGVTGHTLGAAGAVEAVLTLEALNHQVVPPTWGFAEMDEQIGFSPTQNKLKIHKRAAISTSLAFGGCNVALIIGAQDYGH